MQAVSFGKAGRVLLILAAFVIACAGIKLAAPILNAVLLSVFVAVIAGPVVTRLDAYGLPRILATLVALTLVLAVLVGIGSLLLGSLESLTYRIPFYQLELRDALARLLRALGDLGVHLNARDIDLVAGGSSPMVNLIAPLLSGVASLLSDLVLVLILVAFMLLEGARLDRKLQAVVGIQKELQVRRAMEDFQRYLWVKSLVSLLTGILVGLWVWMCGLEMPWTWGVIAFLLNYIPNLGSLIAAVPALLIAYLSLGWGGFFTVGTGYALINLVVGNILEPRMMGRALGLSSLVVLVSVIFWGWLLGPVGAILSGLLTLAVKLLLRETDDLNWVAVLLAPAGDQGAPRSGVPSRRSSPAPP
jgi:AI-2 transport protein TqsA